jgi:hypothetical protein
MTEKRGGKKESFYGFYFLGAVILLYIVLFLITPGSIQKALRVSAEVFLQHPHTGSHHRRYGASELFCQSENGLEICWAGIGQQRLAFSYINRDAESRPYLYLVPVIG